MGSKKRRPTRGRDPGGLSGDAPGCIGRREDTRLTQEQERAGLCTDLAYGAGTAVMRYPRTVVRTAARGIRG